MAAFELHRNELPAVAASDINPGRVVKLDVGDTQRQVVPVATNTGEPFGVALATGLQGKAVTIEELGSVVKVPAGASLGAGADVGVASTNGALGPVSAASGSVVHAVGKSLSAAAAGEQFSLYVRPRQLSGTP
jgi:hypothetical protein